MLFFGFSPTGQTCRRIFTHDGSNDADSRKDVLFGGFFHITPHLRGQKPPKNQFLGVNRPFQAKLLKSKNVHIIKTISSIRAKFLHSDKDHQMPFVGGPDTSITNPRWLTSAILEKSKNRYVSAAVQTVLTKFGSETHSTLLTIPTIKIWNLKNPRWRRPPSWKSKNSHISAAVWPILTKFGSLMQFHPLDHSDR